jgi:hypothetical protein
MTEKSFSLIITRIVNDYVDSFLEKLSIKYNIKKDELMHTWQESVLQKESNLSCTPTVQEEQCIYQGVAQPTEGEMTSVNIPVPVATFKPFHAKSPPKSTKKKSVKKVNVSNEAQKATDMSSHLSSSSAPVIQETGSSETISKGIDLEKLSKKELILLCKENKIKCTGTKEILIDFLKKFNSGIIEVKNKTKHCQQKLSFSIDNKLKVNTKQEDKKSLKISKNEYGNYMHEDTSLIFDRTTQRVIGKQFGDKISKINLEDIETCKNYKFDYDIPFNLDSSTEDCLIEKYIDDDDDEIEEDLIEEMDTEDIEELELELEDE